MRYHQSKDGLNMIRTPEILKRISLSPERFWSLVYKSEGCWLWMGTKSSKGYGMFQLRRGVPLVRAHRVSYFLNNGPLEDGIDLHHTCTNKSCVNPAHLQPINHYEHSTKSACRRGHDIGYSKIYIRPDGRPYQRCLLCDKVRRGYIADPGRPTQS